MSQPTPAQLNALLQYAAAKLGMPAEQLAATVSSGGVEGLLSSLSGDNRRRIESLLADRSQAEALLSSPQFRELLKRYT